MKKNLFPILLLAMVFCLGTTACHKKQHLYLSKNYAIFAPVGGLRSIRVMSDNHWSLQLSDNTGWLAVSPMEGNDGDILTIQAGEYLEETERNAVITVVSENGKVKKNIRVAQRPINIAKVTNRWWFLHYYERWETDYYNDSIEDSHRDWTYWVGPQFDNWFFYFREDSTGLQWHTKNNDTVAYLFHYVYYPLEDSLYICFETDSAGVEDYLAEVERLDDDKFIFQDEWAPHRFERLTLDDVTAAKHPLTLPKKVMKKPAGPLIQVDN